MKFWFFNRIKILLSIPFIRSRKLATMQHFWELGYKETSVNRFIEDINRIGGLIIEKKHLEENPYHYFFLIKFK